MKSVNTVIAVMCLFVLMQCGPSDGYRELAENYRFQLLQFSDLDKKISPPCYVQFKWLMTEQKDTLINERLFIRIDSIYPTHGITESLSYLNEGESGLFQTLGKFIELELDEILKEKAIKIKADCSYTLLLQVEKIYQEEEFENEKNKFIEWISAQHELAENNVEQEIIENFIERNKANFKHLQKSPSGMYYQITPSGSDIKTGFGKKVKIRYKGGVLDRSEQHQEVIQDFRIGEELQVIRAMEELLLYLEEGDSAIFIAPSNLAFGETGSSTGIIPPATPIYYEIVLEKVE